MAGPAQHAEPDLTLLGGRYRLDLLIGHGGMADVFRATDTMLDRPVAVKLFRGGGRGSDRQRFLAECQLSARLSHPNLVTVFDAGSDNGRDYLVMRLIEGRTLADKLDWGPLGAGWACRMGGVVAETLAHVHASGVVHRDVKPSNILLGPNEQPYLADFGIALATDGRRLTKSGQFMGTVAYTSPEQIHGAQAGPAADVYALGLVLLEVITGRVEFDGPESVAAMTKLRRAPEVPASVPPAAASVIRAMVAEDPADRPDAAECARSLGKAARELGAAPMLPVCSVRPVQDEVPRAPLPQRVAAATPRPRPRHRRRRGLSLALAGVFAAGALVAFPAGVLDATTPAPPKGQTVADRPVSPAPTPPANPVTTEIVTVPVASERKTEGSAKNGKGKGKKVKAKKGDRGDNGRGSSRRDDED
ncbi:serine/threonine-protein kinase [Allokutzneria oryzae]|uniref:non-specific serine/threonine protein kinase n=1 Tax=Allokutzneria oryzae TaxID=1378989 RepID=A0ABV6A5K4_9PSEU